MKNKDKKEFNEYLVYRHVCPNGKCYIGQTCRKFKARCKGPGNGYKGQLFYNAVQKYGWDNIEHIVVCEHLTKKEADWLEIYLIRYYESDTIEHGYNLTKGGDGMRGFRLSEETKSKISKAHLGQISPRKGVRLSEETKQKISKSKKKSGFRHSEEWCKEHSEKMKGENNPMYNCVRPQEWRDRQSAKAKSQASHWLTDTGEIVLRYPMHIHKIPTSWKKLD